MRVVKKSSFGPVQTFKLGYSPLGRPFMAVHFYLIDAIMIDTGQSHMRNQVTQIVSATSIDQILLTHHHEDHSGNAAHLSKLLNVPAFAHPLAVKKLRHPYRILPYQHFIWGPSEPLNLNPLPDLIETDRYQLIPIHTPGHSKDHTVYYEPNQGWLFTGDLYLSDKIKYFRVDEIIAEQIQSLRVISNLDFDSLFCAHFPKQTNGSHHIAKKLQFLEDLYGNVAELYHRGQNAKQIMKTLNIKETTMIKWFCSFNVSAINGIRSIIETEKNKQHRTLEN